MQDYVQKLRTLVEENSVLMREMTEEESARPFAPGKWSPRQLLGHLVDSASNNHQRFVRARFQDELVFPGYDQDAWVEAQRYQDASWPELIELWRTFNLHLAHVMLATPVDERQRERVRHNLDRIAWESVPADRPTTLDYFMADYVGHLEYHLAQLAGRV